LADGGGSGVASGSGPDPHTGFGRATGDPVVVPTMAHHVENDGVALFVGDRQRHCIVAATGGSTNAGAASIGLLGLALWNFWLALALLGVGWNLMAYAELGQLDDAWRCIDDAIEKVERSKEKWCEAEVHRIAGEIALKSLAPDPEKAEAYFDRALAVARQQQAKSWELRAAMSLARLWRDQRKPQQARELLAPVYNWFTEGFDLLDLTEAKALLDELNA
jgi:tetratricopeptide (TPR) repeat protein